VRPNTPHLKKSDWYVDDTSIEEARDLVERFHYSKGASNTRVYVHGLYRKSDNALLGVAWWLPPTKSCGKKTYPENPQGVLSLSRLVVHPDVPINAATFLMASSRKLIDRDRWPCLVTYADTWRGHDGAIYKADNWQYVGLTKPQKVYVKDGRMVARKCGPKTRTHTEMLALGCECLGSFPKHKFVMISKPKKVHTPEQRIVPYVAIPLFAACSLERT